MATTVPEMHTRANPFVASSGSRCNRLLPGSASVPSSSSISAYPSGDHPKHYPRLAAELVEHPTHVSESQCSTSSACSVQTSEARGTEDAFVETLAGGSVRAISEDLEETASDEDEFAFVQVALEDTTVVHHDFQAVSWMQGGTAQVQMDGTVSVKSSPSLEVRNTFIHIPREEMKEASAGFFWPTAPSVMLNNTFRTKYPSMEQAHIKGDCRPCAYFISKVDGCRQGEDCAFCHLCPPGALKKKKKDKVKALKERDWLEKQAQQPTETQ